MCIWFESNISNTIYHIYIILTETSFEEIIISSKHTQLIHKGRSIDSNVLVITPCGVKQWIFPKYPCELIESIRFYWSPNLPIQCPLQDCCGQSVEDIRTQISFFLLKKSCLYLNLCFVCLLFVWRKEELGNRHVSNLHVVSLNGVTKWSSTKCTCQLIFSHSFYFSPSVPIQCQLRVFYNLFVEDIRT